MALVRVRPTVADVAIADAVVARVDNVSRPATAVTAVGTVGAVALAANDVVPAL